ncbi:MAG TPA: hypothetical protein VFM25_14100 [Verrucomicrobiae bacterium]|jgi:predicted nucleic acid-binding protein|nr:hypothetical protein [Verrucomicrobiae bacterium]
MIIISDTSAITSLLQINRAEILIRLYQEVIIPDDVFRELMKYHEKIPPFIRIASPG